MKSEYLNVATVGCNFARILRRLPVNEEQCSYKQLEKGHQDGDHYCNEYMEYQSHRVIPFYLYSAEESSNEALSIEKGNKLSNDLTRMTRTTVGMQCIVELAVQAFNTTALK